MDSPKPSALFPPSGSPSDDPNFMRCTRDLLSNARRRARRRGLDFALSHEEIEWPSRCPALGLLLDYGPKGETGRGGIDRSPSLDRLDHKLGYVPGNVVVISFLANRIKNTGEASQIRAVADWLRATQHPD